MKRHSYIFPILLLCSLATAIPQQESESPAPTDDYKADQNFLCPEDCHCVMSHAHKPLLHAKCSSLKGLRADQPLEATLPIHSIDLSYLNLTRLAHSLEKLPDITSIDLSHNDLHEIGHLSRRMKKLNLKHNRLTSAKLTKLPQHLQTLNLQHNDITNLPLDLMKLSQLQTLELSHNPINCSCDTLEVRNWLQERHVFMEHPVKCAYPALYKNKSWLQVKQSLICDQEKKGWAAGEEENELMMGDQPFEGSAEDEMEELGKDFMPIDVKTTTPKSYGQTHGILDDVEGSGDLSALNMPLDMLMSSTIQPELGLEENSTSSMPEEDDFDGSGSGDGMPIIIPSHYESGENQPDDFDAPETHSDHDHDRSMNNAPIEEPTISPSIFTNLGIFGDRAMPTEIPVPVSEASDEVPATDAPVTTEGPEQIVSANVASAEESKATYYLWGVIVFILVALILYVCIKRCKNPRGQGNDPENPQTELVAMDKKQLGKPLRNGVPEHVPLIGEKTKADMAKPINGSKPYDNGDVKDGPNQQQEPLLQGNGNNSGNGNAPSEDPDSRPNSQLQAPHEYYPISPRYPTPQSPRASKYSPQNVEPNNNDPNQPYLPSSPKLGRYSPVYSPETGRVKIKLGETPRPKTPMLVTRSRSNAGDIITTPIRPAQHNMDNMSATPVHTAAATTNGHVGDH